MCDLLSRTAWQESPLVNCERGTDCNTQNGGLAQPFSLILLTRVLCPCLSGFWRDRAGIFTLMTTELPEPFLLILRDSQFGNRGLQPARFLLDLTRSPPIIYMRVGYLQVNHRSLTT